MDGKTYLDVADAKGHGDLVNAVTGHLGHPLGVALRQGDHGIQPFGRHFLHANLQHAGGRVNPPNPPFAPVVLGKGLGRQDGHVRRARGQVQDLVPVPQVQGIDQKVPPRLVHSQAHKGVYAVVVRRHGVKHLPRTQAGPFVLAVPTTPRRAELDPKAQQGARRHRHQGDQEVHAAKALPEPRWGARPGARAAAAAGTTAAALVALGTAP